jgi:hypothetical protein
MKSITIHGIDTLLDDKIKEKAKREGISINKVIKKILGEALGFNSTATDNHEKDFLDLFGTWSKKDEQEFNERTQIFEIINPEEWQQ